MTIKNKRNKSNKNKNIISLFEVMILICVLFIGIGIGFPLYFSQYKKQQINKDFYYNQLVNDTENAKTFTNFWKQYDIALKMKGDSDGNKVISIQEKKLFDEQFLTANGLNVDPVTKEITKKDGTHVDSKTLSCLLSNFYPAKPWIKPVCPTL